MIRLLIQTFLVKEVLFSYFRVNINLFEVLVGGEEQLKLEKENMALDLARYSEHGEH